MKDRKKLTLLNQNGRQSLFGYRHLYIRGCGTAENPDRYEVLKTDKETVMHRSTMKGCKRFITNRKQDLDALCEKHGISGSEIASTLA